MQKFKQYNGFFGCNWCFHPGTPVASIGKMVKVRYGNFEVDPLERDEISHIRTLQQMELTGEKALQGVLGKSELLCLDHFDFVWGMCPEFMHNGPLGVFKTTTELWFSDSDKEYYIGSPRNIALIDHFLLSIKPS